MLCGYEVLKSYEGGKEKRDLETTRFGELSETVQVLKLKRTNLRGRNRAFGIHFSVFRSQQTSVIEILLGWLI